MNELIENCLLKTVAYLSPEYQQLVQLRYDVLRAPLGLDFSVDFLVRDTADILIGTFMGDEAIGCCQLTLTSDNIFQLRQMAVAGKLQGSGIGGRLVSFAEDIARQNGGVKITLHAREVATGFYQKLGYTAVGEPFTEIGLPHIEMMKDLNALM